VSKARLCDGCGKVAEPIGKSIPVNWFSFTLRGRKGIETDVSLLAHLEVCSAACATNAILNATNGPH
jgi:hypothetical protein